MKKAKEMLDLKMNLNSQRLLFWRQYISSPLAIGAIAPSSERLARQMLRHLSPGAGLVMELGPGTGVFTRALLAHGVKPEQLLLIEANASFAAHLEDCLPGVTVIADDAGALPRILQSHGHSHVAHIISGLPFRSLKPQQRQQITAAIGEVLQPGGVLVQFTYSLRPPIAPFDAKNAGLIGKRKALVVSNLPPAFVWRYEKVA